MNFLLYGKPGSGKTTAACTTPRRPILIFDIDNKANQMYNIKHLVKSRDVIIKPFSTPLVGDSLRDRALNPDKPMKNQPEGYLEIVDFLSDILEGKTEYSECKTIVIDSFTRLAEHLKRLLIYLRGQGKFGKDGRGSSKREGDMNWPSWGSYLSNIEELMTNIIALDTMDLILCAHEKSEEEKDQATGTSSILGIWPMVEGAMMKKLSSYFDEVYYLNPKITTQTAEYRFRTRGTLYCCRSSLGLNTHEPADINHCLKRGGVI